MKYSELKRLLVWLTFGACGMCSAQAPSGGVSAPMREPTELGLEDLLGLEVTSAAKKSQRLVNTAAAVFVITQDDIRRTGATSIPEALRMVPGMEVANLDAFSYAITARGFNSRYANKLLVLIDGRSVYSPLYSGVFWEEQDTLLTDIERIEVIRGPGASLWGANAVNGVINIITRSARNTEGGLATITTGNQERGLAGVRYGGKLGEDTYYRAYLKGDARGAFSDASGTAANDDSRSLRAGFRTDGRLANGDGLTLQGDWYQSRPGETFQTPILTYPFLLTAIDRSQLSGGNLLGRWTRTFSSTSSFALQAYFSRASHADTRLQSREDTVDVDFQHRFAAGERHDLVWGATYRRVRDDLIDGPVASFLQQRRESVLYSVFAQDEIALVPEQLRLTLGSRVEHSSAGATDVLPSVRLLWSLNPAHSTWGSIAKAVRTPALVEQAGRFDVATFPGQLPTMLSIFGVTDIRSEELVAYEIGYRFQGAKRFSLDVSAYHDRYLRLRSSEPGAPFLEFPPAPPHLVIPVYLDTKLGGRASGIELAAEWRPYDWWRWHAAYTYRRSDVHPIDGGNGPRDPFLYDDSSPRHQFNLRASVDVDNQTEVDVWVRHVTRLAAIEVPAYTSFNLRLARKVHRNLELSLVAQNLFDRRHPEFAAELLTPLATQVPRSLFARALLRF